MKVKELIERLQELEKEVGNVDVEIIIEDIDGTSTTGFQEINEVEIGRDADDDKSIYIAYLYKNDKNCISEEE